MTTYVESKKKKKKKKIYIYIPDKKRNAPLRFSPLSSTFNTKMLIVMKYSFLIKFY